MAYLDAGEILVSVVLLSARRAALYHQSLAVCHFSSSIEPFTIPIVMFVANRLTLEYFLDGEGDCATDQALTSASHQY